MASQVARLLYLACYRYFSSTNNEMLMKLSQQSPAKAIRSRIIKPYFNTNKPDTDLNVYILFLVTACVEME